MADFAEIENSSIVYSEPSRYPEMDIDISFVSDMYAPIGNAIKAEECPLIKNVSVVDTYTDDAGKSITVRITFSHPERTLTKEETMSVVDSIVEILEKSGIPMKK